MFKINDKAQVVDQWFGRTVISVSQLGGDALKLSFTVYSNMRVRNWHIICYIEHFLSNVGNFKCGSHPNENEIKVLFGSATFPVKEEGKLSNYPILIEVEGYEHEKGNAARVSLRGGNGNHLISVYQLFIAYF